MVFAMQVKEILHLPEIVIAEIQMNHAGAKMNIGCGDAFQAGKGWRLQIGENRTTYPLF